MSVSSYIVQLIEDGCTESAKEIIQNYKSISINKVLNADELYNYREDIKWFVETALFWFEFDMLEWLCRYYDISVSDKSSIILEGPGWRLKNRVNKNEDVNHEKRNS